MKAMNMTKSLARSSAMSATTTMKPHDRHDQYVRLLSTMSSSPVSMNIHILGGGSMGLLWSVLLLRSSAISGMSGSSSSSNSSLRNINIRLIVRRHPLPRYYVMKNNWANTEHVVEGRCNHRNHNSRMMMMNVLFEQSFIKSQTNVPSVVDLNHSMKTHHDEKENDTTSRTTNTSQLKNENHISPDHRPSTESNDPHHDNSSENWEVIQIPYELNQQKDEDGNNLIVSNSSSCCKSSSRCSSSSSSGMIENLIVTTKSYQVYQAVKSIKHRIDSKTHIILLCNGALAVKDEILTLFSSSSLPNIHMALTTHGAYRMIPPPQQQQSISACSSDKTTDATTIISDTQQNGDCTKPYKKEHEIDSNDGMVEIHEKLIHAGCGMTYIENFDDMSHIWNHYGNIQCQSLSTEEMIKRIWYKIAVNCIVNPYTALYQCRNGQLIQMTSFQQTYSCLLQEIVIIYHLSTMNQLESISFTETTNDSNQVKLGSNNKHTLSTDRSMNADNDQNTGCSPNSGDNLVYPLLDYISDTYHISRKDMYGTYDDMKQYVDEVIQKTSNNFSSMYQDIYHHQQQTEVDYLTGYVIRQYQHCRDLYNDEKLHCPINEDLYHRMKQLEKQVIMK